MKCSEYTIKICMQQKDCSFHVKLTQNFFMGTFSCNFLKNCTFYRSITCILLYINKKYCKRPWKNRFFYTLRKTLTILTENRHEINLLWKFQIEILHFKQNFSLKFFRVFFRRSNKLYLFKQDLTAAPFEDKYHQLIFLISSLKYLNFWILLFAL